jgi:surface protein
MLILRQKAFVSQWDTRNISAGSSTDTQIKLPLVVGGTYNCRVYWGDGTVDHITAYDQADVTHTYAAAGIYTIRITGTITGWKFNNGGDKLKITALNRLGCLRLGNAGDNFYGCTNMVCVCPIRIIDADITSLVYAFADCYLFNPPVFTVVAPSVTSCYGMCFGALIFNPSIFSLNVAVATNLGYLVGNAALFNPASFYIYAPLLDNMLAMFYGATKFNKPLTDLDTSAVTTMQLMLALCTDFNQSLASFSIPLVTTMANALIGVTLSPSNYGATLTAWAAGSVQDSVSAHMGSSKYPLSAKTDRDHLTTTHSWTITDNGYDPDTFILTIGDSKTYLAGWQPGLMTALYAADPAYGWGYINAGVGGATVLSIKDTIDATLAGITSSPVPFILINLGANDVGGPDAATWKSRYQYIIDACHVKYPSALIYLSKVWRRGYVAECAAMAGYINDLVAANTGVCFVADNENVWLEGGDDGATMTTDGVHYSATGNTTKPPLIVTVLGY